MRALNQQYFFEYLASYLKNDINKYFYVRESAFKLSIDNS